MPTVTHDDVRYLGERIIEYRPLPAMRAFHKSRAKYRWLCGGNRSGKSQANIGFEVASFALGVHPFRRTPENAVIWCATVTWPMVGKILWQEKLKHFLPAEQIAGISWHIRQLQIPAEIRLRNGIVIEFKSLDAGREVLQGRAIDMYAQDEQAPRDSEQIFQEVQARLLDRNGFATFSMTPIIPCAWLEERLRDLPEDTDEVFYANLEDNRKSRGGYIDDAEVDMLIAQYPEEVRETRIRGYFSQFAGSVYKTFNRSVHVCDPFEIPTAWPRWRSIDWGFNHPHVCLWLTLDEDGIWYVYEEHFRARESLKHHADKIKALSGRERYRCSWADHDLQDRHEFETLGIKTVPARKDVRLGIELVQSLLKVQGNGKPRLMIFRGCKNTIRQMVNYRWSEPTETSAGRDEPLKIEDDCCDALRYCVFSVEGASYFRNCDLS